MLEEAVNNKRSANILAEVRKLLAVDMALAKNEIRDAIVDGKADAVLAASIFHFGTYSIKQAKQHMDSRGIPIRL